MNVHICVSVGTRRQRLPEDQEIAPKDAESLQTSSENSTYVTGGTSKQFGMAVK